jgi:uncharacterized protein
MDQSIAMPSTSFHTGFGPTAPSQRIQVIDILRGLAIFGILMVNMHFFAHPWLAPHITAESSTLDVVVNWIVNVFFTTKFFSLFSFLFGLGMAIQMHRAEEQGVAFVPLYVRRLLILMVFGLAHAILLWIGDILFIYSIVGFLILLFWRKARPRTLVIWACILLAVLLIIYAFGAGSLLLARTMPEGIATVEERVAAITAGIQADLAHDRVVYATGSYWAVTRERAADFVQVMVENTIWITPSILGMFLLGLYFGKRRIFENIEENLPFLQRLLFILLPIGLLTNILWASLGYDMVNTAAAMSPEFMIGMMLLAIGGPTLALSYVSGVVLLTRNPTIARRLAPLAAVGRLALTNYLMHSIVMTTLFYGYGFGLLGSVGMAGGVFLGIVLYVLQIPFSNWWVKRFRFGPFEWLWRSLTYGRAQPMRVRQIA